MYKIVALMGKSGSGKDTILKNLINNFPDDYHEIISCTSRPIRENEQPDVNYHYITKEEFFNKIAENKMIEYTIFNNWLYGTCFENLDENKINIGIYNPAGVRLLLKDSRVSILPIFIVADSKTRLLRQLTREENPDVNEIIRRYGTDEKDFYDIFDLIKDPSHIIYNEHITPLEAAEKVETIIKNLGKIN